MRRRGWVLTALGVMAAIAAGVVIGAMTFPSGQPAPAATATATTVRIDPVPTAAPTDRAVDSAKPVATPIDRPGHSPPRPTPRQRAVSEPDPATVTTINSW